MSEEPQHSSPVAGWRSTIARYRDTIRLFTGIVAALVLILIALSTTSSAGDASGFSAERGIEEYAEGGFRAAITVGIAISVYIVTKAGD